MATQLAALVLVLPGCGVGQGDYPPRVPPAGLLEDVIQQAEGARLFQEHCATCHGKIEEGRSPRAGSYRPPPPDFTQSSYTTMDPAYLFWRVSEGKMVEPYLSRGSVMPAWGGHLSETQLWQLVAYLRTRPAGH